MSTPAVPAQGGGRETRLLLVTIAVSVAVLLVLARFRFPDEHGSQVQRIVEPLARLATPAPYDELATTVARVDDTVQPSLVLLRGSVERPVADLPSSLLGPRPSDARSLHLALRVRDDVAIAAVPSGVHVSSLDDGTPVTVMDEDPVRGLIVVRVPPRPAPVLTVASAASATPRYVAVAFPSEAGAAVRPSYLARARTFAREGWAQPLVALGTAPPLERGAVVFTLDAELIGMMVGDAGERALVPPGVLLAAADAAGHGHREPGGEIGVALQPLSPALQLATGAQSGAVVAAARPDGPAAGRLEPGDVIETVDGKPVVSPSAFLDAIGDIAPGVPVQLGVRRGGEPVEVRVEVSSPLPPPRVGERDAGRDLGLILELAPGVGSAVRGVAPQSMAEAAGLLPGDVVTRFGRDAMPTPARILARWKDAPPGSAVLAAIVRGRDPLVVAVEKP